MKTRIISRSRTLTLFFPLILLALSLFSTSSFATGFNNSDTIAITNVRVFNGYGLSYPKTVVIEDGVISWKPWAPFGSTIINGHGRTLIPGLIDSHVHASLAGLQAAAQYGVTSVLDMGGNPQELYQLQATPDLPDLLSGFVPATAPGSETAALIGLPPFSTVVDAADAERFVNFVISLGANYVKVILDNPDAGETQFPQETLNAIVQVAHTHGLRVVAHATGNSPYLSAVAAGVDAITHTSVAFVPIFPAVADQMAASNVAAIPTLGMMDAVVQFLNSIGVPADYALAEASASTFIAKGITVMVGTDSNESPHAPASVPFGSSVHDEMVRLVAAGMTPVQALNSATQVPAQFWGLNNRGKIANGYRADMILINGNPTVDITATQNIEVVIMNGKIVQ